MRLPKCVRKAAAFSGGYFWLPCPICGEEFGGHEWKDPRAVLKTSPHEGWGVCSDCIEEAQRRNAANMVLWAKQAQEPNTPC